MLKVKYGNKHRLLDHAQMLNGGQFNNHEWTVFVQLGHSRPKAQELFKSVTFILPATYNDCVREVVADDGIVCKSSKSFFECKEASSKKVLVQIEIHFNDKFGIAMEPIRLQHLTKFTSTGETVIKEVPIPRAIAKKVYLC